MSLKLSLALGVSVLLIVLVLAFTSYCIPQIYGEISGPGIFGDMFGAANALFSGLALAGVIAAILLQSQELRFQREELEMTRVELKRAADAQTGTEVRLGDQIKMSKEQARLSALSSLVLHYTQKSENASLKLIANEARTKSENYASLLERYFEAGEIDMDSLTSIPNDITSQSASDQQDNLFGVADIDPNLALVALRIEIERALRDIAFKNNMKPEKSLQKLLASLRDQGAVPAEIVGGLYDLIDFGNRAAHGATVPEAAVGWALEYGVNIVESIKSFSTKSRLEL